MYDAGASTSTTECVGVIGDGQRCLRVLKVNRDDLKPIQTNEHDLGRANFSEPLGAQYMLT